MRCRGYELDLIVGINETGPVVLGVAGSDIHGVALDIGSTSLECSLFDLSSSKKIDVHQIENPQVSYGSDVLTRVQRSMMGDYDLLSGALRSGINSLINDICGRNEISPDSVFAVTIAGNTIMSHFFLGLEVNNIPISPYIPVVNSPVFLSAAEAGLNINESAVIYVFPNSGSYVGGDIISGIIYSGLNTEESPVLFIDVGTNVEITLGCRDWIMTGAGAAGPALEGGVADIGRKAAPGTIDKVLIDPATLKARVGVIDGAEPAGICGSGLIDLVYEMFKTGIIDQTGSFTDAAGGIVCKDGVRAYEVHSSGDGGLFITEAEIKNFLVSKAAMFSFLYVFVKAVGLTFGDIKKVYVSGALGCGINPESAVGIGMLPDIPRDRLFPLGNSSLGGAEMLLLDDTLLEEIRLVGSRITYREMNEDAELMNILQGAIFIPHTEPGLLKV
ncbi:MAG: DUF4445 domain-containing protein [Nitrospirae bacterium]|nr:DUF4445 domain-containing protein [Nitrospirota bacterium]